LKRSFLLTKKGGQRTATQHLPASMDLKGKSPANLDKWEQGSSEGSEELSPRKLLGDTRGDAGFVKQEATVGECAKWGGGGETSRNRIVFTTTTGEIIKNP